MMHAFGTQQFIGARAGRPRVRAQLDPAAAVDLKLFRARAAAAVSMLAPLQPTSVSTKAGCSPSATLAHGQRWRRRRRLAATVKSAAHVPAPTLPALPAVKLTQYFFRRLATV